TIDLLASFAEGLDDAHRVFPAVEPRNLRHQRAIHWNAVAGQTFAYVLVRQFAVLGEKRIYGRRDDALLYVELLRVLRQREDCGVILLDEAAQIVPHRGIGRGEVDVALP